MLSLSKHGAGFFSKPDRSRETNILEVIDAWGRKATDSVANISGERRLIYAQLSQGSYAVAAHLAHTLSNDGSPVAVLGHKEPELLIAFLGAGKAGHPYVPIDRVQPPQRIERIVAAAGCRVTLTPERIAALAGCGESSPKTELGPADPYYIMFTSGSTGEPKGVVIPVGCLSALLDWLLAEHSFEEGETFLNQVSYGFDVSVMDTFAALLTGGTVFSVTQDHVNNPKRLFESLTASGVTTWVSTPSFAGFC